MEPVTTQILLTVLAAGCAAVRGNFSPCGESLQAQIHPLGEHRRGNRWVITVAAFTLGSMVAGGAISAAFGTLGSFASINGTVSLGATAWAVLIAGMLDLVGPRPAGPRRQVNENWIGRYRGWVYGIGFGIQLGLGFSVFVMSWGYYAMLAGAFLSASGTVGFLVGAIFGLLRGVMLFLAGWIDSPERLASFHEAMARARKPVFAVTAVAMVIAGPLGIL